MARCRCEAAECTCVARAGANVVITGTGSPPDPWIISATPASQGTLTVEDSFTIDLTLTGLGTIASPYKLVAHASQVPGGITTGLGITGLGNGPDPLRIDLCSYDDLAAACAP